MASNIDGTIPVNATPIEAPEIQTNFLAAKNEIEALQAGVDEAVKRENHTGVQLLSTISDAKALAAKDLVDAGDMDSGGATDGQVATADGAGGVAFETPPTGAAGHVIQEEGAGLAARANLNFIGATVSAADDAGNDATTITISAGAGGGDMDSAVYDPQGIAADAFNRGNHTGVQLLSTISDAKALAAKDLVDAGDMDSGGATDGQVATADGAGGVVFSVLPNTGVVSYRSKLIGYEEEVKVNNLGTFEFTLANFFYCIPTGDITIAPYLDTLQVVSATVHMDNTGGHTITMPTGTEWVGGVPTLGTKYAMTLYTMNGGVDWFAVHVGDLT